MSATLLSVHGWKAHGSSTVAIGKLAHKQTQRWYQTAGSLPFWSDSFLEVFGHGKLCAKVNGLAEVQCVEVVLTWCASDSVAGNSCASRISSMASPILAF
eukprot:2183261-Amphidinium_carterae.1